MKKISIFLMLMALFVPWALHAQQTVTVCDGTETNEYIPVYGYYADTDGATSEFILPSTTRGLSNMIGAEITGMTFYISSPASSAWGSTFEVYMTEVDYTTQTNSWTGEGTVVYTGELDGTGTIMEIEFDEAYVYQGGNLLIGTYVTDGAGYDHTFFYGIEAESGASINVYPYGGQYYGGARAFLPKTTFTYVVPDCPMPTLSLDYTEGDTRATVSWTSDARSFNVMVNGEVVAEGIRETSYTIRNLASGITYTVSVQADCGETQSRWASTSFFTGCPRSFEIPYAYGFEDVNAIDCWTIDADDYYTGVQNNDFSQAYMGYNAARTGDNYFFFFYTQNPPSYLISPQLSGIRNGLHVEFFYRQDDNGVETFHVGYSTGGNDPENDFIWGDEITASTSYQRFSANYPAGTKYVAVKLTSDYQYYLYLDDFLFEESASCLEPTGVQVADVTTSGANVSWTAGGEETTWDIYVTDDYNDEPDENTRPTYEEVSDNPYTIGDLDPGTIYYVYVRAICDEASAWSSPAIFNTECEAMALPYTEDFADGMSVCWTPINTNTSYNNISIMALSETTNVLSFYRASSSGDMIAVLPEIDENYPLNEYQISFYACYARSSSSSTMEEGALSIGVMTDPTDASTFEEVEGLTISDAYSNFGYYLVRLNEYTGSGHYLAIKNEYTGSGYVLVGNIEVTELPACFEPTNMDVDVDGLYAYVTWDGEGESFDIAFTTDPDDDPDDVIIDTTTDNEFDLSDYTQPGYNFVYVRTNCGETGYSEWVGGYFNITYCAPYITQHDGYGITGVSFGTGDDVVNQSNSTGLPSTAPYYGDYSDMIGAVQAGVESTIAITTSTDNYPYTFVIWVDLDNSLTFDDEEILYVGTASEGNGTLNATITIPADQLLGDYRMRIFGADSYFENFYNGSEIDWDGEHDPCGNPSWAHVCDFTLRVLEAPSCLPPTGLGASVGQLEGGELQAVLYWSANGDENGWTIYWKESDDDEYQEEYLDDNSYPLGVDPQTTYEFYVVADCGIDDESDPSVVYEFTAPCLAIVVDADNPFTEGFEDETWPPDCWTSIASGSNAWDISDDEDYIYTGTGSAYSGYYGDVYLVMPNIQLGAAGDQAQLSFWTINRWPEDFEEGNNAVVLFDGNGETELWVPTQVTEEWEQVIIDLSPYTGQIISLAFKYAGDWGNAYYVDDVEISVTSMPAYTKIINGYDDETNPGGWYLIASPVDGTITPTAENGFITTENGNDYDLYRFNQNAEGFEWENYKMHTDDFVIENGMGYLYANKLGTTLTFIGSPITETEITIDLDYNGDVSCAGWNLIGNPFAVKAYTDTPYYSLEGSQVVPVETTPGDGIEAMEGIFVEATEPDQSVTFTTEEPDRRSSVLTINLTQDQDLIDRAIVRFDEGSTLSKFQLFESSKLYIPQDGKDYAIVRGESTDELPVNFKAMENGSYTLSFTYEEVEFSYLHLFDNLTGDDVDLLATPSYTFNAQNTDNANRFRLVFDLGTTGIGENFAFFSNGNFIISNEGEATLQVVDVTGRILSSETVNGNVSKTINAVSGVYMLRLINGDSVKVQKVVVR